MLLGAEQSAQVRSQWWEGRQQLGDGAVQPTCSFLAPPPPPPAPPLLGLEQTGNTRGGVRKKIHPPFRKKER